MANKELSMYDLLIESHIGLDRQGIGSPEATAKALRFIEDLNSTSKAADLACGTGGQTMVLAQHTAADITGVDICPDFIDVFNDNAAKSNLAERMRGIVASIEDLPFQAEEFDLIWSEGVIDSIGFEKGFGYWRNFLKTNGYIAVTCPSWLTTERPAEIEKFWTDAVQGLGTVSENITAMQKTGYEFIAAFALPETCWTDNYFTPRTAAEERLLDKYAGNELVKAYVEEEKYEIELYAKYKPYYGYIFYIGKKI